MQHTKRWLAAMLAAAMTLSDFGGMTVLATENTIATETSVSENTVEISDVFTSEDETTENDDTASDPSEDTEKIEIDSESDTMAELPALHIGQIEKGEELPNADDTEFKYDLPVSFALSDQIVLFANYNLNAVLEEGNGTFVWSILRGEKGMTPGSTSLMQEDDDWTDFDAVSSSPYFTLTENKDEKSDYYQTVELTLKDIADDDVEVYNYYIRVAYYLDTDNIEDAAFYAAATIPFLPRNTSTEEILDDTTAMEDSQSDSVSDNTTSVEDTAQEELQNKESVDATSDDVDADVSDSLEDDSDLTQALESVSENSNTTETLSALAEDENNGGAVPQPTKNSVGVLTVSAESVTLHPTETISVSATVMPKSITELISWESSDTAVATVDANGKITAIAKGIAQITAKCGNTDDITATVKVNVIEADENEVYDLSGDIWVSGFQKENKDLVYTGQKITQSFQVYYKETLLKEKTDYTLSYKNNVNAATWNAVKAPSVTITMKGQYQGSRTLYYTIYPADIKDLDIYNPSKDNADENDDGETASSGYKQTVNYSKNLKIPAPELTLGKKKLVINKDFSCDYSTLPKDFKNSLGVTYRYTVNGIGNFTGSIPIQLVVLEDKTLNFSSASVTLSQKQYEYPLSKTDVTITKLKISGKELDKNLNLYDFEVYADEIDNAYIMVYPTAAGEAAGYCGFKKVALKLVGDRKISESALGQDWKSIITFSQKTVNEAGGLFQETTGVLTFGEGEEKTTLIEGQDYTVKYTNAKKVGTVTATFTGKGRYTGTRKEKYKIEPNIDKNNFTIRWKNVTRENDTLVIAYQKGGAVPDFILVDRDNNVLKTKTDYTVKLTNNKQPGDMTCEITGKGNYKGYKEAVQIQVKNGDISQCTLSVPDKPYSTKENAWKSKVTVKDVNGKTLAAGKDYETEIAYSYDGMENEQPPAPGTTVTVTVKGKDLYAGDGTLSGSYRIFQNNISKLQIVIDSQEYTGKEITLSDKDIHVYATAADKKAKNELANATSCYKIVEYKNNIKAGTAKVTLRGDGNYGGTKTYNFKILKKVYLTNRIKGIKLDKANLNISLAEKQQRTLTATLIPNDASQAITNSTVIWSTSNSNIATAKEVESAAGDKADTETDTKNNTVTAAITVKSAGTVTITATTQDGNKKTTCKIKITVPTLKEKGQTIRGKTGDKYQLSFVQEGDLEVSTDNFIFESDNETVASVDEQGLITMNRFGATTIKVYIGNDQSVQQCYIIVEKASDDELNDSTVLKYEQEAGCTDDTKAINDLLYKAEHNDSYDTVYIPAGTYHIDCVKGIGGIILRDNQNLIMAPDAKLVAIPNGSTNEFHVICAFGRSNITISGGQIIGEREDHQGKGSEDGHGIQISGCTNVYISDVEVSKCWGDGIYLCLYNGWDEGKPKTYYSRDITIENCNLHHNRRSNLSITDNVSNVTVNGCHFYYASGTAPECGINIEPGRNTTCSNVTISDSSFYGNKGQTIQILGQLNAHIKGVTIKDCRGDKKPLEWSGFGGSVSGVKYEGNNNWSWKP